MMIYDSTQGHVWAPKQRDSFSNSVLDLLELLDWFNRFIRLNFFVQFFSVVQ